MPPKPQTAATAPQAGPSPVPPPGSPTPPPPDDADRDAQDMLVLQDLMDTLEQMPAEMTRVHSDLNELGAVLYSTLQNLESKLGKLIDWLQDATVQPEQRFGLLMEIAEEAARYKLGGDDKIRVAAGACDGLMAHQKHISNLLAASSLLDSAPPSPYTRQLTLPSYQAPTNLSRRQIARQQNSPFTGAARERAVGDTPTKKKKSRVQQLGREDDDSSAGGKKLVKKKKLNARAPSPTESVASASFAPNPAYPRTARQLAAHQAAQQKAKRAERDEDSDESEPERMPEIKKRSAFPGVAQGMQVTPSTDSVADMMQDPAGGSTIKTPTLAAAQIKKVRTQTTVSGVKRGRDDESEDDKPLATSNGHVQSKNSRKPSAVASGPPGPDGEHTDGEVPEGAEGTDGDKTLYCTCRQVSWGEMIGCDDDECEFEWYHITCLGYDRPPEGTWYCPQCAERRKRNPPKSKKPPKGKARR